MSFKINLNKLSNSELADLLNQVTLVISSRLNITKPGSSSSRISVCKEGKQKIKKQTVLISNLEPYIVEQTVLISNLEPYIVEEDIKEIFSRFGTITRIVIHYDSERRSLGIAELTFDNSYIAVKCVEEYDGAEIDGRPMSIKLLGST